MNRPDIRNRIDNIITELAWCVGPLNNIPINDRIQSIMLNVAKLAGEIEQEMQTMRVFERYFAARNSLTDEMHKEELRKAKEEKS